MLKPARSVTYKCKHNIKPCNHWLSCFRACCSIHVHNMTDTLPEDSRAHTTDLLT